MRRAVVKPPVFMCDQRDTSSRPSEWVLHKAKGPLQRPSLVAACHLREVSARVRFAAGFRAWKRWLPRCSYPCRCEWHRRPETSFVKPGREPRLRRSTLSVNPQTYGGSPQLARAWSRPLSTYASVTLSRAPSGTIA